MSTDPPSAPPAAASADETSKGPSARTNSFSNQSQASNESQTAAEFIRSQELLEADAREALPYSIENCTKILGPLRQAVFACLTCNPAPNEASGAWTPAGVCYACSVQCHGEHTLVEIFQKRNFTCDCGTTRIPSTAPCTLRADDKTNIRSGVHSEEPDANNKYNQNFRNRFCACECDYDPFQQKGTMFQCLGLGTVETGGCGEDWYHPGCVVGMGPEWFEKMEKKNKIKAPAEGTEASQLKPISEEAEMTPNESAIEGDEDEDEVPMPPGFPDEEAFEGFLCYKCVEANPWIKRYAGTSGFLPPVFLDETSTNTENGTQKEEDNNSVSRKRQADGEETQDTDTETKRVKTETTADGSDSANDTVNYELVAPSAKEEPSATDVTSKCKLPNLPPAPKGRFSLFFKEDFREKFCRCSSCYPFLNPHPQLLGGGGVYEPPISEDGASQHGGSTQGSGSLLERGESALRNVDRVRAIEGVMAYNHLKEKLKPFFQQFAESGQAIGAEDIKSYFAKLRGDEADIKEAGEAAASSSKDKGTTIARSRGLLTSQFNMGAIGHDM